MRKKRIKWIAKSLCKTRLVIRTLHGSLFWYHGIMFWISPGTGALFLHIFMWISILIVKIFAGEGDQALIDNQPTTHGPQIPLYLSQQKQVNIHQDLESPTSKFHQFILPREDLSSPSLFFLLCSIAILLWSDDVWVGSLRILGNLKIPAFPSLHKERANATHQLIGRLESADWVRVHMK